MGTNRPTSQEYHHQHYTAASTTENNRTNNTTPDIRSTYHSTTSHMTSHSPRSTDKISRHDWSPVSTHLTINRTTAQSSASLNQCTSVHQVNTNNYTNMIPSWQQSTPPPPRSIETYTLRSTTPRWQPMSRFRMTTLSQATASLDAQPFHPSSSQANDDDHASTSPFQMENEDVSNLDYVQPQQTIKSDTNYNQSATFVTDAQQF